MRAEGVSKPFYPLHFLGVFRQVAILRADGAADVPLPLKKAQNPTKAVMIAPWAEGSGFSHDSLAVSSVLKGLYSIPPGIPIP